MTRQVKRFLYGLTFGSLLSIVLLVAFNADAVTHTLMDTDSVQTATNKTFTSPILTTPSIINPTITGGGSCASCALTSPTISGTVTDTGSYSNLTTTGILTVGSGANVVTTVGGLLKATMLDSGAWAIPGPIGGTTPNTGKFTTVESTIATGNPPFIAASTTQVTNLNASLLIGGTWAIPGTIGSTTPNTIVGTTVSSSTRVLTPGSGTGITVNNAGEFNRQVYKVTITSSQFISNAVTHDVTWVTVPAKTRIIGIVADLTQTFACAAVCTTSTLSATVGKTAGGNQYLVSFDMDAATARFGLADADLGTSINRASAIQGGDLPSWTGATTLNLRMTSGTGNLGNGSVTNLSQGSITLYLIAEIYP